MRWFNQACQASLLNKCRPSTTFTPAMLPTFPDLYKRFNEPQFLVVVFQSVWMSFTLVFSLYLRVKTLTTWPPHFLTMSYQMTSSGLPTNRRYTSFDSSLLQIDSPTTLAMKVSLRAFTATISEYLRPPSPHPPTATETLRPGFFCFKFTNSLKPPFFTSF